MKREAGSLSNPLEEENSCDGLGNVISCSQGKGKDKSPKNDLEAGGRKGQPGKNLFEVRGLVVRNSWMKKGFGGTGAPGLED